MSNLIRAYEYNCNTNNFLSLETLMITYLQDLASSLYMVSIMEMFEIENTQNH